MDADTVKLILSMITVSIAIFGIPKVIFDFKIGNRNNAREEYRFAKEFLADLSNETLHPFAIQKGYQILARDRFLDIETIKYALTSKDAISLLTDLKTTKKIIHYNTAENRPTFKGWYRFYAFRLLKKTLCVLYCLFSLYAFPWLMADPLKIIEEHPYIDMMSIYLLRFLVIYILPFAIFHCMKIRIAEKLIKKIKQQDQAVAQKPLTLLDKSANRSPKSI